MRFSFHIAKLSILLLAVTALGFSAIEAQKQGKEAEAYKLAGEYTKQKRWQDLIELCQRHLRDKPNDADMIWQAGFSNSSANEVVNSHLPKSTVGACLAPSSALKNGLS